MEVLGKKLGSVKKLAKKVKVMGNGNHPKTLQYECLRGKAKRGGGTFVVYVGEERERFVVPMAYLSHPLFKIVLEKVKEEFGFDQPDGLVVPCSVEAFREVIYAIEGCKGIRFDFGNLVEEFI